MHLWYSQVLLGLQALAPHLQPLLCDCYVGALWQCVFSPSTGVQPQLDQEYPKRGRRWR